jgi:hypothetical protein
MKTKDLGYQYFSEIDGKASYVFTSSFSIVQNVLSIPFFVLRWTAE